MYVCRVSARKRVSCFSGVFFTIGLHADSADNADTLVSLATPHLCTVSSASFITTRSDPTRPRPTRCHRPKPNQPNQLRVNVRVYDKCIELYFTILHGSRKQIQQTEIKQTQ